MKKRFWQPIWKFEEVEKELAKLEQEGWRLDRICGFRRFEFVKSRPKTAQYFFTHDNVRENVSTFIIEQGLKQNHNANRISGNFIELFGFTSLYRITAVFDATEQTENRNILLQYLLLRKAIIGLVLLLFVVAPIVLGVIFKPLEFWNDLSLFEAVFLSLWFFASLIFTIHNLRGYFYIKRKNKTSLLAVNPHSTNGM